jgi:hypothetical protein
MQISEVRAASGKVTFKAEGNFVTVAGEIDQMSPRDFIAGFFELIHNMAMGENLAEVRVDLTRLLFLNSSGIKEFLSWILRRNRVPPEQKYRIVFLYDPRVTWQPITLPRLRDLDPDAITLEQASEPVLLAAQVG